MMWVGFLRLQVAFLLASLGVLLAPLLAHSAEFDVIVPTSLKIQSVGSVTGFTLSGGGFGWLVVTDGTLGQSDLEAMQVDITFQNSSLSAWNSIHPENHADPLGVGEGFGQVLWLDQNALYLDLLDPSEVVHDSPVWQMGFNWPIGFSGIFPGDGTVRIGDQVATFSFDLDLGPHEELLEFPGAQRVYSVVPEPSRTVTLSAAMGVIVLLRCVASTRRRAVRSGSGAA